MRAGCADQGRDPDQHRKDPDHHAFERRRHPGEKAGDEGEAGRDVAGTRDEGGIVWEWFAMTQLVARMPFPAPALVSAQGDDRVDSSRAPSGNHACRDGGEHEHRSGAPKDPRVGCSDAVEL